MHKKADAFARYGDAAVLQMVVEVPPSVVAKASEPLSTVDKMTVISTDGASQLSRTVADNVAQGVELLRSTTGVDLASLLKALTSGSGSGSGSVASAKGQVPAPAAAAGSVAGSVAAAEDNGRIEVDGEQLRRQRHRQGGVRRIQALGFPVLGQVYGYGAPLCSVAPLSVTVPTPVAVGGSLSGGPPGGRPGPRVG